MKLADFDYNLPKELIAQYPAKERDACRLMVLDRKERTIRHRVFSDIADYFREGDCLVLNNTRVIPTRIFGKRKTGGKVEIFLLEKKNPICEALVRPASRLREGERVMLEGGDEAEVLGKGRVGRLVRFDRPIDEILKEAGHMPLPPYIAREDKESDIFDYQTVYAEQEGATASPTAGLHFTKELIESIKEKSVNVCYITLHTSYGTFAPIKSEAIEEHRMHEEYYELPKSTAGRINQTKQSKRDVYSVGTTSTRVLEGCAEGDGTRIVLNANRGNTDLFVYPGYRFKIVDHLITNFHLPKSTLLLLVSAFAGREFIFEAYRQAIRERYRFFSYGDAMLIL